MPDTPTWKLEITYSFRELLAGEIGGEEPSPDLDGDLQTLLMQCVKPEEGQEPKPFVLLTKAELTELSNVADVWACRDVENKAKRRDWNRLAGTIDKLLRTQPDGVRRSEPAAAVSVAPRQASLFDFD